MNKIVILANLQDRKAHHEYINSRITKEDKKRTQVRRQLEDLRIQKELVQQNTYY